MKNDRALCVRFCLTRKNVRQDMKLIRKTTRVSDPVLLPGSGLIPRLEKLFNRRKIMTKDRQKTKKATISY